MNHTPENLLPFNTEDRKRNQVRSMFDAIAFKYDLLNRLLSFRQDTGWRKKAIKHLKSIQPKSILDIATGTGDFALEANKQLQPTEIVGADLSEAMMEIGREKIKKAGLEKTIRFEYQDCTELTYNDNTFDAVIIAFGVRNFESISKGIQEMYRVLRPGGMLVILELSRPEKFPMKQLFHLYASTIMPLMGKFFSKNFQAYQYLPASIQLVPQGKEMCQMLDGAGFKQTLFSTYTMGICSMYSGIKP